MSRLLDESTLLLQRRARSTDAVAIPINDPSQITPMWEIYDILGMIAAYLLDPIANPNSFNAFRRINRVMHDIAEGQFPILPLLQLRQLFKAGRNHLYAVMQQLSTHFSPSIPSRLMVFFTTHHVFPPRARIIAIDLSD